jgi:hypothetical protein
MNHLLTAAALAAMLACGPDPANAVAIPIQPDVTAAAIAGAPQPGLGTVTSWIAITNGSVWLDAPSATGQISAGPVVPGATAVSAQAFQPG